MCGGMGVGTEETSLVCMVYVCVREREREGKSVCDWFLLHNM